MKEKWSQRATEGTATSWEADGEEVSPSRESDGRDLEAWKSGELSQLDPSYSKSGLEPAMPASSGSSTRNAASQPPCSQSEMDHRDGRGRSWRAFLCNSIVRKLLPEALGVLVTKELTCQCRRLKRRGFDPWLGRSPGEGNDNPLQYSCLGNPTDRGVWWATVHEVTKSRTEMSDWTPAKACLTQYVRGRWIKLT